LLARNQSIAIFDQDMEHTKGLWSQWHSGIIDVKNATLDIERYTPNG
jgi:hypothetical protein